MGYDITRFEGEVDEELICSICSDVLEEPLHAPRCEHAFCKSCINEWLTRQPSCPVDRQRITTNELIPVPRLLRNLLSRLMIKCDYAQFGCTTVVQLERLEAHKQECEHDPKTPKRPLPCDKGCGLSIPKDELKDHNCFREMRRIFQIQFHEMQSNMNLSLNEMRREIRSMRCNSRMQVHIPAGEDDTTTWAHSLQRAQVTNWAFLFSLPDPQFYILVGKALYDSGCPARTATKLMECASRGGWPSGLRTVTARDSDWYYEHYVCRRIPGVQAVVVMAVDNLHMNGDMIQYPGHVMIFSRGIQ